MEYRILDIPENCTLEQATKALRSVRIQYHPDKLVNLPSSEIEKNRRFLNLAEEAFECIRKKMQVHSAMGSFNVWPDRFDNVFKNIDAHMERMAEFMVHNSHAVHTSTYMYQNVDGDEKESGYVNGQPMSESDLQRHRPKSVDGSGRLQ